MGFLSQLVSYGYRFVVGVDEAGRGPLAGPVVAAAVAAEGDIHLEGLKDSKLLTPKARENLEAVIKKVFLQHSYSMKDPVFIDRFGIAKSSKLAMAEAVNSLGLPKGKTVVLVDGPWTIPVDYPQIPIVKGDRKISVISAASILAKVKRDRIMEEMDRIYPGYGFSKNKGYPTKEHIESLRALGPSPIHRRSFRYCH